MVVLYLDWMFRRKKYRLGIALSGGGARGFAHLGILKALEEKGIKPDIIAGVSAGAIAGAFIASGKSPHQALDIIEEYRFFDLARLRFPRNGFFTLNNVKASIEKEIPYERLEQLPIPLLVGATDILEGKVTYFSEGPIAPIVQASGSIPILFNPVSIEEKLYADGGILANQPIKPLFELCRKTIMVNISPVYPIKEVKNMVQMAARVFQLGINAPEEEDKNRSSVYIEPTEIKKYDFLDTKHAKEIFEIGYEHVSRRQIKL